MTAILRCTAKYRKAFGLPNDLPEPAPSESALGEWYGNTLNVGRARYLHYMAAEPRLSVIVPLRDRDRAEIRLAQTLLDLLLHFGVNEASARREIATLNGLAYARASDRSVLGSMRDQAILAKFDLDRNLDLWTVNLRLSDAPCSPIGWASPGEVTPKLVEARWTA
jgi:hypothetical protein